jgi:hypothetical protein
MASYTDFLIRSGSIVVHITMTQTAFDIVDAMFRIYPLLVHQWSLLFVAIHAILFAELNSVTIRAFARGKRRRNKLLPAGVQLGCSSRLWTIGTVFVSGCRHYWRSHNTHDDEEVENLFHLRLLLISVRRAPRGADMGFTSTDHFRFMAMI